MSRTVKAEWTRPDGWHMTNRIERKARPAGRLGAVVARELELELDGVWVNPADEEAAEIDALNAASMIDDEPTGSVWTVDGSTFAGRTLAGMAGAA